MQISFVGFFIIFSQDIKCITTIIFSNILNVIRFDANLKTSSKESLFYLFPGCSYILSPPFNTRSFYGFNCSNESFGNNWTIKWIHLKQKGLQEGIATFWSCSAWWLFMPWVKISPMRLLLLSTWPSSSASSKTPTILSWRCPKDWKDYKSYKGLTLLHSNWPSSIVANLTITTFMWLLMSLAYGSLSRAPRRPFLVISSMRLSRKLMDCFSFSMIKVFLRSSPRCLWQLFAQPCLLNML